MLHGCVHSNEMQSSGIPVMVGPEKALVMLSPGSFYVTALIERTYANAVIQQIILRTRARTPGENYIKVSYWGATAQEYQTREQLPYKAFHQEALAREMQAEFPTARMVTSPDYLQNDYGAFSYAVGKGEGRDICLFGWQQIRAPDDQRSMLTNNGMIQIRVRLCETDATPSVLLSIMYHYILTGHFDSTTWNPYGAPPPLAQAVGNPGQPTYPVDKQAELDRPALARLPARPAVVTSAQKRSPPPQTPKQALVIANTGVVIHGAALPVIPAPLSSTTELAPAKGSKKQAARASSNTTTQPVVIPSPNCVNGQAVASCE